MPGIEPLIEVDEPVDLDRFRLRAFVDKLRAAGELVEHAGPLDLVELPALLEQNPKAVLMRGVGAERHDLVGNVAGSRARLALAFGVPADKLMQEVQRRLRIPPRIVELSRAEAPAQQVVLIGDDADLATCPCICSTGSTARPIFRRRSISSSIRAPGRPTPAFAA